MRALLPALVGAAAFVVPFELAAEEPGGTSTTGAKTVAESTAEPPGDLGHKEAEVPPPPTIVEKPAQPIAAPAVAQAAAPAAAQAAAPGDLATSATKDELEDAGYLPGYRAHPGLGASPFSPLVGGLPGGITPSFMAPMPPHRWTLRWSGYFSASAQFSTNERVETGVGQSHTIVHAPPATVEEYASFLSTNTVPGHWVQMQFSYGDREVTAVVSITTWNPSDPTTYYQIGSQNFINNAYLNFQIPEVTAKLHLSSKLGYFYNNYGSLGQYNLGMYQNPIAAIVRGVGGTITGEYDVAPKLSVFVEEGLMGNRNAKAPNGLTRQNPNYNTDPTFPASYIQHLHLGVIRRGELTTVKAQLHHIFNWAMDDRPQTTVDNMVTRGLDESYIRDARMSVTTAELNISHPGYGMLAIAASHIDASYAYGLKGVQTFGGEGQTLTERWLGNETTGTGTVNVVGFNYTGTLGHMIAHPAPFDPNRSDLVINAGLILANSHSPNPLFDGRKRYKAGLDLLYILNSWMGVALRVDRVAPNSRDSEETFHVVAPRLVFKTNWTSRENISVMYAKWFYGTDTHGEFSVPRVPRLDDQLFALNVNMGW
jgi:hypothetical protein